MSSTSRSREMLLLIRGASQVVQVSNKRENVKLKDSMGDLAILSASSTEGISIAVDNDGRIAAVGMDSEISKQFPDVAWSKIIDAKGQSVVPGMVDAHTHPVWAGDRVHEFAMKLAGASYMEVHKAGGGINFTVEKTKSASEKDLLELLIPRLQRMIRSGTTLVECKSGYGLDTENEMKMLRVLEQAKTRVPITISSTFCGAHSVPRGLTADEATRRVIEEQLPALKIAQDSGEVQVDSIDVFCEHNVFDVDQTRRILEAGKRDGLLINFHAEELRPLKSAEMGAALGSVAMSHLEEISYEGINAMAKAGTVGVLLPTTAYILRLASPPARAMIKDGVPVALGTDFNPNAFCLSMPLVMHLACVTMKMSLNEALTASTLHAAHSLRKANTHGSIEPGKMADIVIVDSPRWEHLVYQFGGADHVIAYVIKNGTVVHARE